MTTKTANFDSFNFTKQLFDTRTPCPLTFSLGTSNTKNAISFNQINASDDSLFSYETEPNVNTKFSFKNVETSFILSKKNQQVKLSTGQPLYSFTFDAFVNDKTVQKVNVNAVACIYKNVYLGVNYLLPFSKLSPLFINDDNEIPSDDVKKTTSVKELLNGVKVIQQNSSGFICYQQSAFKKYSLYFDYSSCVVGARMLNKWNNIIIASEAIVKNRTFEAQTAVSTHIDKIGQCTLIINSKKQAIAQITHTLTQALKLKIQYFHTCEEQKDKLSFGFDLSF